MAFRDVRMRGFAERATVAAAWAWVDAAAAVPLPGAVLPLDAVAGRVLAEAVVSSINLPDFARSAMDGYAVRADETLGAGDYNPVMLRLIGQALPAAPFTGSASAGETVRIMTGAPLPAQFDSVVPAEVASEVDGIVEITQAVAHGRHVAQIGEDVPLGSIALAAGRRLRPQDLAVAAAVGCSTLSVVRRPRVRIVVTGQELVAPEATRTAGQIFEANSWMLRALVTRDGGEVESLHFPGDDRVAISATLQADGADLILISGGTSVGAEDHAPGLIAELGELAIHGVAMRPASPAGMGRMGSALVFLLPGNPASCLCAYDFFAGRALRRLAGLADGHWPYRLEHRELTRKISSAIGRMDYCRVRLAGAGVEPVAVGGAAILSSTTRADGFVVVPESSEGYPPGVLVDVWRYD